MKYTTVDIRNTRNETRLPMLMMKLACFAHVKKLTTFQKSFEEALYVQRTLYFRQSKNVKGNNCSAFCLSQLTVLITWEFERTTYYYCSLVKKNRKNKKTPVVIYKNILFSIFPVQESIRLFSSLVSQQVKLLFKMNIIYLIVLHHILGRRNGESEFCTT